MHVLVLSLQGVTDHTPSKSPPYLPRAMSYELPEVSKKLS